MQQVASIVGGSQIEDPGDELFDVAKGDIPLLNSYGKHEDWGELFHTEKTEWMGWEKHIIEQMTQTTVIEPQESSLGEALSKLITWKSLKYSIFGNFRVHELIVNKISELSKKLNVTTDLAQALLVSNSWDDQEVIANMKNQSYVKNAFKFDFDEGSERI